MRHREVYEKLRVLEYTYPFASKANPILEEQIVHLSDDTTSPLSILKLKKPDNINAQFTGWQYRTKESERLVQWIGDLISRDLLWSKYTVKPVEVWGVLYKKGDYITSHAHTPSLFSAVYYVNAPKGSSPLVFSTTKKKVIPAAGKLVIFESRLVHEVPPNKGDGRCMVSANYIWDKDFGTFGYDD